MAHYGAASFIHKIFITEEKIEYTKRRAFKKSVKEVKIISKKIPETDTQLWTRINDFVEEHGLVIINIETITTSEITTGGNVLKREYICNDDYGHHCKINGFRIFFRNKA